jgi:hypothetical protein
MLVFLSLAPAVAQSPAVLPVRRIRFYETGVAWFERDGVVSDRTALPVPTSHLDDAIKTLVVLGGDVELGSVSFPSALEKEAARARAGLSSGGDALPFEESLRALLGVSITVEAGGTPLSGVLVDVAGPLEVVRPTELTESQALAPEYALTLFAEDGAIHRVTTGGITAIRSEEVEVADRLTTAARSLAHTRAQRPNALEVDLEKGGRLGLGYLAEAPVWRVSYRILNPEDGEADLQAWALVHNDTDEDWTDVQLELANGEPDSFLYPLAAPRYAERELRTPDRNLGTVGQLVGQTADELWNQPATGIGLGGIGSGSSGYGGGGMGYGSGGIGGVIQSVALKEAEPVETPTQFVYRVAQPVDLRAHHTALVPLVQDGVPAEAAVVFAPHSHSARNGLWLRNGTRRTLPEGVLSVLQSGGLAGEAELERLKPDEVQMVTFGNELDVDLVQLDGSSESIPESLALVREAEGRGAWLRVTSETRATRSWTIRNRSGRSRSVWLGMELGPDQEVEDGIRSEIDPHTGWTWAVLDVPAGTEERQVVTSQSQVERLAPASVRPHRWREWAEQGLADTKLLLAAADIAERLAELERQEVAHYEDRGRAESQLTGLRQSLTAAEGSDAIAPLARRAASVEAELRKLDESRADLERRRQEQAAALLELLAPITVTEDGNADAG